MSSGIYLILFRIFEEQYILIPYLLDSFSSARPQLQTLDRSVARQTQTANLGAE